MKKLLAVLLTLCLVLPLAACNGSTNTGGNQGQNPSPEQSTGQSPSSSPSQSPNTPVVSNPEVTDFEKGEISINKDELPRFKIAFGYGDWESVLGTQFMHAIEYLADAFNCESVFFNAGSGEEGVANLESLLAAGDIDGIISASGWDTGRMEVANRYGVPIATGCQFTSSREIDSVASYSGFLGGVTDDEVWAGYHAMKALYEAGSRNVTWSGLTVGFSQGHDDRTSGALQFVSEKSDLNLLTESYTRGTWHEDVPSFAAAFPEMDGMAFTALNVGVYNAMEIEGIADGSVKIAGPDVASGTGEYFERGVQVWSCGGQYATVMVAWAILYNYLIDGTVIISDPKVPLFRNYLEISSFAEYQQYEKIINSPNPAYNAEEIAQLIHYFNPDVTYDDYVELGRSFSIEDILARQASW